MSELRKPGKVERAIIRAAYTPRDDGPPVESVGGVPTEHGDSRREFQFGKGLSEHGYSCCGKPKGCTNMNPGCVFLQHPYKRWLRGEITMVELNAKPMESACPK